MSKVIRVIMCTLLAGVMAVEPASAESSTGGSSDPGPAPRAESAPDAENPLQKGLKHRWRFNEADGSVARDAVKPGVDGQLSAKVKRVDGIHGGGIKTRRSRDSFVAFGGDVGQFGTADFTVALGISTKERLAQFDVVGNRTVGSHGSFFQVRMTGKDPSGIGVISAEVDQDAEGTNYATVRSAAGFNDGVPHFVTVTRAGPTLALYVDGKRQGQVEGPGVANIANENPLHIGRSLDDACCDSVSPVMVFDGLRIYDRALSAAEVKALAEHLDDDAAP